MIDSGGQGWNNTSMANQRLACGEPPKSNCGNPRDPEPYGEPSDGAAEGDFTAYIGGNPVTVPAEYWREAVRQQFRFARSIAATGYVYFASDADGLIKIGYTADLKQRRKTLRVSTKRDLSILASVPGNRETERAYHMRFCRSRVEGEWFARHPDIFAEIDRLGGAA